MLSYFLGGLALFLYGQFVVERGVQQTGRIYLRTLVKLLTKHRITAVIVGSILAVGMQSSTVPVLTLINLINVGVAQLGQALGMVLGASVGTTVIVQAISFDISKYGLWLIVLGFVITKFTRRIRGDFFIGFGFIFYGLYLLGNSVSVFKETQAGVNLIHWLSINPFRTMAGAFILTVLSQSTLAPLAVGISLVREGGVSLAHVIPIIFGAHIGAGIVPLVYSWRKSFSLIGRQLSVANMVFRIVGGVIFMPLVTVLAQAAQYFSSLPARQLANAHTILVVITAIIFVPIITPLKQILSKFLPERSDACLGFGENADPEKFLKEEEERIARDVCELFNSAMKLWEDDNDIGINKIESRSIKIRKMVDRLMQYAAINICGARDSKYYEKIVERVHNACKINDIIGNTLTNFARRRIVSGRDFSMEGLNEMLMLHKLIMAKFESVMKTVYNDGDVEKNSGVDADIKKSINESFSAHLSRINKGFRETKETRMLHMDAIAMLQYIHWCLGKMEGESFRTI